MNLEAERITQLRKEEMKSLGGEDAYRRHALEHLRVKSVIKESHCTPVHALCFNQTDSSLNNLFATVGGDQATVYDDEHMGDYLGVVVHFQNVTTEYAPGGDLSAACWLDASGSNTHPHGDTYLAVSGSDHTISIISVVESRVIKQLTGHKKEVMEISAPTTKIGRHPGLLASLSRDGEIKLWNVHSKSENEHYTLQNTDASSIALLHDEDDEARSYLVVGTTRGRVFKYAILSGEDTKYAILDSREELKSEAGGHGEAIDCMRSLPGSRLATKSSDGRMFVWKVEGASNQLTLMSSWKVPGCHGIGFSSRCQFGCTSDGSFIAVGNTQGDSFVFDAHSGQKCAHVTPIKVSAPVRACGLSNDCRHLLTALGNGFIFRFEYNREQHEDKENTEVSMEEEEEGE